jgi:hypothetical protein
MWKNRHELPVLHKLNWEIDIERLSKELEEYAGVKVWDSLGVEYASLCETHTKLPKMFFKEEELDGVDCVCDLDWEHASYQQLTMTEFDETFDLDQREEQSGTMWDSKIAKRKPDADERWFRKLKDDVPPYLREILSKIPGAHRTRIARLAPNSEVKPHIDYDTTYGVRIHIPLRTNPRAYNGGWNKEDQHIMQHMDADGSAWFVNPGVKHYAVNAGDTPRDHLIISVDSQKILEDFAGFV